MENEREEEECLENQQNAHHQGFCCHYHEKKQKKEWDEKRKLKGGIIKKATNQEEEVYEPNHCHHCDEDPCVFQQIELKLCENDDIYFDEHDYAKAPVPYNSARRKRAYQFAAFILWEGINYRQPHYKCVEDGVRSLFPPLDGKTMGYKKK